MLAHIHKMLVLQQFPMVNNRATRGEKTGLPQRLEYQENEYDHGKVMEHEKSHGILPILALNFTKFVPLLWTLRNLASV